MKKLRRAVVASSDEKRDIGVRRTQHVKVCEHATRQEGFWIQVGLPEKRGLSREVQGALDCHRGYAASRY